MSNNKAFKVKNGLELQEYAKSIADTAVDVFVYDTRKDSDGGAWRKRTQHTSWYNETLNTATRGSRKEFPAVAVIVAESNQVTIYDGDDPDLPMWMVLNERTTVGFIRGTLGFKCISALNGVLVIGSQVLNYVDFVSDSGGWLEQSFAAVWTGLANRDTNNGLDYPSASDSRRIVALVCNDVAMTVLPNAPIDETTGLPVPTIAVATEGGVSVVKDDGSVVDITATGLTYSGAGDITFTPDNEIIFTAQQSSANTKFWLTVVGAIPETDLSAVYWISYSSNVFRVYAYGDYPNVSTPRLSTSYFGSNDIKGLETGKFIGGNTGLVLLNEDVNPNESMVAYITSTYNTGWMNGDIKLATLSDTDDTDVTGSELVTVSSGTDDGNATWVLNSATQAQVTAYTSLSYLSGMSSGLTTGERYTLTLTVSGYSGSGYMGFATQGGVSTNARLNGNGTVSETFVYTGSSPQLFTLGGLGTMDITIRLAEADRSVNGNGLQVFGTVTKSAVATGADLVAYSGFSNINNYLEQPYNADMQFGTSDFCIMGWFKNPATTGHKRLLTFGYHNGTSWASGGQIQMRIDASSSDLKLFVSDDNYSGYDIVSTGSAVDDNVWHFACAFRQGSTIYMYLDGAFKNSTSLVYALGSLNNSQGTLQLGKGHDGLANDEGYQALWRISATAPTAEQIAKIYEDEKVLFQEGAQATLYGSSDSVTALAYDDSTELLHVGTSAGRSVFSGLRRVDNTTDAVDTAISASNGMVAED